MGCDNMQTSMNLEIVGGDSVARHLQLKTLLPEGKLAIGSKALDFGSIPVGVPQTSVVSLNNSGLHDAVFQVASYHSIVYITCNALLM